MQSKALTIAIIELGTHHEVLWSIYHQCRIEYEHIHVITTVQNHMFLKHELKPEVYASIHLLESNASLNSFFTAIEQVIESCDHILISTLLPHHFSYFLDWTYRKKSLLLIHDLHYYFDNDRFRLDPSTVREVVGLLKYKVKNYQKLAASIVDQYKCLVCSAAMLHYARQNHYQSIIDYLDLGLSTAREKPQSMSDHITIVIPGSVSSSRRNYEPVLLAFKKCQIDIPLKIIFAGFVDGPSGQKIIDQFYGLDHSKIEVMSYHSEISHDLYIELLSAADFLLIPIAEYKTTGLTREHYGYSSHSGSLQDITRYGTKSIIPAHYPIPKSLKGIVSTYIDADDLRSILEKCRPEESKPFEYVREKTIQELFRLSS